MRMPSPRALLSALANILRPCLDFRCTVRGTFDPAGTIKPGNNRRSPGIEVPSQSKAGAE
jgi:hypothetical protein